MEMIGQVWTMQKQRIKNQARFYYSECTTRRGVQSADDELASIMTGQEEQSIVQGRWTELIRPGQV
jgi:hypothetical protein